MPVWNAAVPDKKFTIEIGPILIIFFDAVMPPIKIVHSM